MIRSTGITRRWLRNSFTIIMLALVLITIVLGVIIESVFEFISKRTKDWE